LLFWGEALFPLYVHGINVNLEINGIKINNGTIYVAIYSNENDYNRENAFVKLTLEPDSATLNYNLDLPDGEYVVTLFQDNNSNGKLDTNIFGIPKEPVGITNYNGRGRPGGFQKLKVVVNNNAAKITVYIGNI
jgi:uncharacterized protein (DUF2141 family)